MYIISQLMCSQASRVDITGVIAFLIINSISLYTISGGGTDDCCTLNGLNVYHIKLELCKYFVNASECQVTCTCVLKKKGKNLSFLVQPICNF